MILRVSTGWLRGVASVNGKLAYVGSRYLYSIGAQFDILGDDVVDGIRARFPLELKFPEALAMIGRDRSIVRGFAEPARSYAIRLTRWMDDWRLAGSAFSVLRQLQGYLTPYATTLRIVNNAGCWYTLNPDGSTSYLQSGNWNWDGNASLWARFWVIIYCSGGKPFDKGPKWGDPGVKWGQPAGRTWGSTATSTQVKTIRGIVQQWKGAHAVCQNIILAFDPASFDPTAPGGAPLPDGTWGRWANPSSSPFGSQMARLPTARYWDGVA